MLEAGSGSWQFIWRVKGNKCALLKSILSTHLYWTGAIGIIGDTAVNQMGFPCGSAGSESICNVEDLGSIPGLGRSLGEGNSYPLQCSGLENIQDKRQSVSLTLCHPMDCSPPCSSIHGISQARVLEWIAISFSRGSSQSKDWTQVICIAGRFFSI